ncbi:MAG: right-handed parallel beta-helix repeat-containing protein, partial [Gammaproteobacteria bacterium]|nr:right-handed parallel beta-helix repeat-containing protein [Gammaproteobacteria bacterium]
SFSDLTITGPGDGLLIHNSRVRLFDVRLIGNEGAGVSLDQGGALWMNGGEVSANAATGAQIRGSYAKFLNTQVTGNSGSGISATGRATVHLEGGAVSHNDAHGIDTTFSSALFLSGTELSKNGAVGGYGAYFGHGSSGEMQSVTITENGGEGVEAYANSSVSINGGSIFANDHNGVSLGFGSVATLRDVQISANIATGVTLWAGSGLFVYGDSDIPPNGSGWSVDCDGKESSLRVHDAASVPAINCSDPEF